jgi:Tfp pilus assembly protein PilF
MNEPDPALRAYDEAEQHSPYHDESAEWGREFRADVAVGRARAWRRKGDMDRAGTLLEHAVTLTPQNSDRWLELAEVYQAQGQTERANQARAKAREVYGK